MSTTVFARRHLSIIAKNRQVFNKAIHVTGAVVVHLRYFNGISSGRSETGAKGEGTWKRVGEKSSHHKQKTWTGILAAAATGIVLGATFYTKKIATGEILCKESIQDHDKTRKVGTSQETEEKGQPKYGARDSNLPTYRRSEVAKHNTINNRIWVTFNHGVYDVTDFINSHPGGPSKIKLASGKGLEPFFNVYAAHKSKHVMEIMESLRIGNVHPDDMKEDATKDLSDPFVNDPKRHPALHVNSLKPFNAEPPAELLLHSYNTPNDLFFVRNHLPVPKINSESSVFEVCGQGLKRPVKFSVQELKKKFKVHTINATVQCAGNRRSDMATVKSVKGLSWGATAISNATWTGVKLTDVLAVSGAREEDVEHVIFQGADKDIEAVPYEASIPAATAFDPRKDVLLAFEMNGEELPLDHGYPIRVIVPGVVGARNVKWLKKITVSKKESEGHWQQNDYKAFNPSVDWGNVDFSKSVAIQEYPIQSAICEPAEGTLLDDNDEVTVKGYAWSGGGRGIIRVDLSADGGKTWQVAELEKEKQPLHREWAWTIWEATIPIPDNMKGKKLELVCKAVDTSHNAQPDSIEGIWNLRGLIHNAWHRVQVHVPHS